MPVYLTALLVVVADQLTKWLIRTNVPVGSAIPLTGFARITHSQNDGVIFGLFQGHPVFMIIVAIIGALVIFTFSLYFTKWLPTLANNWTRVALGLILGGTLGNLIDRIWRGSVTDFISVGIWPSFNIADSGVTVGALIMVYFILRWGFKENG